jgi:hypothetical protein
MRNILSIEFQYSRAFLYVLALHAVYQRCSRNSPMNRLAQLATEARDGTSSGSSSNDEGTLPLNDLRKWMGVDSPYIGEVQDACRAVIRHVVDGLLPDEYLKHCPVRTYFRIISSALILLKTFVVGSREDEMAKDFQRMDDVVRALRGCIVDDVHVGNRFAGMCQDLSKRIRQQLVRMSVNGGSGTSRADTPPAARVGPILPPPHGMAQAHTSHPNMMQSLPGNWPSVNTQNLPPTPGLGNNSGRATPSQHIWGTSRDVYDPSTNGMSVLPPPSPYYPGFEASTNTFANGNGYGHGHGSAGPGYSMGVDGAHDMDFAPGALIPDWLALPYDTLLNSNGEVVATPNGPAFGHEDMLDRLLWSGGA